MKYIINIFTLNLFLFLKLYAQQQYLNLSKSIADINYALIDSNNSKTMKPGINTMPQNDQDLLQKTLKLEEEILENAPQIYFGCIPSKEERKEPQKRSVYKTTEKGKWELVVALGAEKAKHHEQEYKQIDEGRRIATLDHYNALVNAQSNEDRKALIREETKNLSKDELMIYISDILGFLPYNDEKARASQRGDIQNSDSFFQMLMDQRAQWDNPDQDNLGGICGDIHFAAYEIYRLTERDPDLLKFYTVSYVMDGGQHVVTLAIDEDGEAYVVNYGSVQKVETINGVKSVTVQNDPSSFSFNNKGLRIRIYEPIGEQGQEKPQSLATVKSFIGSYIEKILIPGTQMGINGSDPAKLSTQVAMARELTKEKTIEKRNGLILDYRKNIYREYGASFAKGPDGEDLMLLYWREKKDKTGKKFNRTKETAIYHTINSDPHDHHLHYTSQNMISGIIYTNRLWRSFKIGPNFQLTPYIGAKLNTEIYYSKVQGKYKVLSGDGGLGTQLGFDAFYINDNGTAKLSFGANQDNMLQLKNDQREYFDFQKVFTGNATLRPEARRAYLRYQQKVSQHAQIQFFTNFLFTPIGDQVKTELSYSHEAYSLGIGLQDKLGHDPLVLIPHSQNGFYVKAGAELGGLQVHTQLVFGKSTYMGVDLEIEPIALKKIKSLSKNFSLFKCHHRKSKVA